MRMGDYCTNSLDCSPLGICRRLTPDAYPTCQEYGTWGDFCEESSECEKALGCDKGPLGDGMCGRPREKGEECADNSLCAEHHTCRAFGPSKKYRNFKLCLEPLANGRFCREDSDCKSGVCAKRSRNKSKLCRDPLPLGSVCHSWNHCASGLACRKKTKDSNKLHCLPTFSIGEPCVGIGECKENLVCRDNYCGGYESEYGQACIKSRECLGNLVCLNRKCQRCLNVYDCPSYFICEENKCIRM